VEPTFASIGKHRRTVLDCEHLPASHESHDRPHDPAAGSDRPL